jgi:hypothetical protein
VYWYGGTDRKGAGRVSQTCADHVALVQDGQQVPGLDVRSALVLDKELSVEVLWQVFQCLYVLPLD